MIPSNNRLAVRCPRITYPRVDKPGLERGATIRCYVIMVSIGGRASFPSLARAVVLSRKFFVRPPLRRIQDEQSPLRI